MLKMLQQSLSVANRPVKTFDTGDGTTLLLLPYGGRVLGLYSGKSDENFYWTNPILEQAEATVRMFNEPGWHNTGGDRTWLAPEVDLFYPAYPDLSRYQPPMQLDTVGFELLTKPYTTGLRRIVSLFVARAHREFEFELNKWFEPALNPLRLEPQYKQLMSAVQYAGYSQRVTLVQTRQSSQQRAGVGICNIIQLPHGGEMIVPTYTKTEPRTVLGAVPSDRLVCEERCIRYKMDHPGEHKIAVRAAFTVGRAGYLRRAGEVWSLVVRNFSVNPSGEYVDVPKDDLNDVGYSLQARNVLSASGAFCELEHHSPAIGQYEEQRAVSDVSQVWAYRGPVDAIKTIGRALLGVEM